MDLPPDKAKVLKGYDDERKWDLICDQVSQNQFFTQSLRTILKILFQQNWLNR